MKSLTVEQVGKLIFFYLLMTLPFLALALSASAQSTSYRSILEESFGEHQSGATAIVAKAGKILYQDAIGQANMELGVKMKMEHIFRIGSITKQFTSVAIMQLEEQGKLSIQDPITKYIPDYPTHGHTITVEHLLTHTSGIRSYTDMESFGSMFRKDMSPMELVDVFKDEPMDFAPGEKFNYNNSGYILLGVIIEKVSGLSYEEYVQKHLFEPLGMTASYYGSASRVIPERVAGYQGAKGDYRNADYLSMTLPYAAGSLLSTVADLYTWTKAVHSHQLVSAKSLEKAFSPFKLNNGEESDYGYGWSLGKIYDHPAVEHGGGINGFLTESIYVPEEKLFVAVFSNCNCQSPSPAANKMAALALGEFKAFTKVELSTEKLQEYVGVYENEEGNKHKIVVEEGQLYTMSRGGNRYELNPMGKDWVFFNDNLRTAQFVRDNKGVVVAVKAYERGSYLGTAKRTTEKVETKQAITLSETELKEYIGTYDMGPFKIKVTLEDGKLYGKPDGDGKAELWPNAKDEFFLKVVDATVEFIRVEGKVQGMKVTQGDAQLEGNLLDEAAEPKPAMKAKGTTDLGVYTGVYESEGRRLTVTLENGFLYGQPEDDTKEKMLPSGQDAFTVSTSDGGQVKVKFKRSGETVTGIKLEMESGHQIDAQKIK
ncbi:MAG: serine hydrolase [Saprospiraceae bacterium]|nr:serine hydrolase [Saprospiraceae bacterium]